ncbi:MULTISPECIES: hypothetical protein [unclassified Streptomyces]|uniref:hypothetical protein n=1 Tax=unclassified Streptomyces TaxID=2593676 RepID=UPI0033987ED4
MPALLVLLPVGFAAGALTDDVDPEKLLGDACSPLVSLAVAVILYEAGPDLGIGRLRCHTRRIVVRLGTLIIWLSAALFATPVLGMSKGAAVMLCAILVVSGPTDGRGAVAQFRVALRTAATRPGPGGHPARPRSPRRRRRRASTAPGGSCPRPPW